MDVDELRSLLQELLSVISNVMQSGEELSDEFQGELATTLSLLYDRIEQAEQQQPTQLPEEATQPTSAMGETPTTPATGQGAMPTGGPVPELDRAPHESSNINALKFVPDKKQLYVKFMGKDTADSGPVYSYQNVPANIFDVIARGGVGPLTSGKNKYHEWFRNVLPSHGAAVSALLKKGGYAYERVS